MNHIIQTGTDSEGAAVTTTLNVQMTYTFAYLGHECQNFVNNQLMPLRREKDMVKQVKVRVTGTDGTTANASHLESGQSDQTHQMELEVPLPWRAKANGEMSGFLTPYSNVTETMILNWAKSLLQETDKVNGLNINFATVLYGPKYKAPE